MTLIQKIVERTLWNGQMHGVWAECMALQAHLALSSRGVLSFFLHLQTLRHQDSLTYNTGLLGKQIHKKHFHGTQKIGLTRTQNHMHKKIIAKNLNNRNLNKKCFCSILSPTLCSLHIILAWRCCTGTRLRYFLTRELSQQFVSQKSYKSYHTTHITIATVQLFLLHNCTAVLLQLFCNNIKHHYSNFYANTTTYPGSKHSHYMYPQQPHLKITFS